MRFSVLAKRDGLKISHATRGDHHSQSSSSSATALCAEAYRRDATICDVSEIEKRECYF